MQNEVNRLKRQAAHYFQMAAMTGDPQSRLAMLNMAEQKKLQALTLAA